MPAKFGTICFLPAFERGAIYLNMAVVGYFGLTPGNYLKKALPAMA